MKKCKEIFKKELDFIKNIELKDFIEFYMNQIPQCFYTVPASSTGKYHPEYSLGECGLVRHTKSAVRFARELLSLEQYFALKEKSDEIIAALIIHDSLKHGHCESTFTVAEHPTLAKEYVIKVANEKGFSNIPQIEFIAELVGSHMGQWNTDYKTKAEILPKPQTFYQKFVHTCDYLASRKWIYGVDLDYEFDSSRW